MAKVLLTGANGFIGQAALEALSAAGHQVTALRGRQELDLSDVRACEQIPEAEMCIHLAGRGNPIDFDRDRAASWRANLTATLNLFNALRERHYQRVILASTYVYGKPDYLPVDESHPVRPPHPYPRSKYLCEQLLEQFVNEGAFEGVSLRIFNVYGPGQSEHMLIPTIIQQLKAERMELRDAAPKRDFVHVSDVARACVMVAEAVLAEPYRVYNLGAGQSYSVAELVDWIQRLAGRSDQPVLYANAPRAGEVNDVRAEIKRVQIELGWSPRRDLESGLKELIACAS